MLGLPVAFGNKTRISDTQVEIGGFVGRQVKGFRRALVHDDEIATGGTVVKLCNLLIAQGIQEIMLICTHGLFLGNALQRLSSIPEVQEFVTTDTVPFPVGSRPPNMTVLSTAPVFSGAIRQNYSRRSIGELFDFGSNGEEDSV